MYVLSNNPIGETKHILMVHRTSCTLRNIPNDSSYSNLLLDIKMEIYIIFFIVKILNLINDRRIYRNETNTSLDQMVYKT